MPAAVLISAALVSAVLVSAALAFGCAAQPAGTAVETASLRVRATAVTIPPAELHGLSLVDAVRLTANHEQFGGFSGLLVENGRLTAVTDEGWLLSAELAGGATLRLGRAAFAPLPGGVGLGGKAGADAESLARRGRALGIGFERDHRIAFFDGDRPTGEVRDERFGGTKNNGLEALATLPDGRLLGIRERQWQGTDAAFVLRPDGGIASKRLQLGGSQVTGADLGPDGKLYVLRRDFSLLTGLSARIERYWLGEDGFPRPETREVLARFESDSGIDNMEGIATWREAGGGVRLMLISDDNFNWFQRTLLLEFVVE